MIYTDRWRISTERTLLICTANVMYALVTLILIDALPLHCWEVTHAFFQMSNRAPKQLKFRPPSPNCAKSRVQSLKRLARQKRRRVPKLLRHQ